MQDIKLEVTNNEDIRIDNHINLAGIGLSRSHIQKLIKDGAIKVNGKEVKSSYKVSIGELIEIQIPSPSELDIQAEDIPLDIRYEDDDLIIVNKPKGMVVHPSNGHISGTLVNALMYHCKDNLSSINGVLRPGIVHRIDKDTTGLLIVCKNDRSHNFIANQLREHTISRKYHAIVHGVIKEDSGVIENYIGRHNLDRKKFSVVDESGKYAYTRYRVLQRFKNYTYIECELKTGRTHQIRVHMAYILHPLLGDGIYGYSKSPFELTGQCLHAKTLGFIHPSSLEYVEFDSELPEYFDRLLNKL
ncbi:MAG: RluA family pseudouridine synthase [Lachnospiraceae bacterium]|jgi:pseudouridine synthase, rluA family|nr:MAG: RluA family pseudouridine synthase [Lachnospiraceae bacterium]